MFGTIATMKVKPGQLDGFKSYMEKWERERGRETNGFKSVTVYQSVDDPNEVMMAVVFESKESYQANADSPEQDKEYREMLNYLDGEPRWRDGNIISHLTV
jgi:heme-degrading monooxygenase HmoA